VRLNRSDILGIDTTLEFSPDKPLTPGHHKLIVDRSGDSTLNLTLNTAFLRMHAPIKASGNGITLTRKYFKVRTLGGGEDDHVRHPLRDDATIAIGDIIEVELTIQSEEHLDYVAFEDMKPAGCEPIQLQSGRAMDGTIWATVELRDDRVVFFASSLPKGPCVLRYKLRAETPGRFHARPAHGFAMYAPEIWAQSDEWTLRIHD